MFIDLVSQHIGIVLMGDWTRKNDIDDRIVVTEKQTIRIAY